ncbi:unnamed protein product [Medioppia subpectinata]|uniref:Uncharacterized protein n=1 Tax=Medioppia subpectinata TaxID=1979941 RepID=A0A7R9KPR6_9ACAR|nr:unnamed protein product [Medioppia subpectinata]CAG2107523.1 unnamed protein product [Medioppia subpectinata]
MNYSKHFQVIDLKISYELKSQTEPMTAFSLAVVYLSYALLVTLLLLLMYLIGRDMCGPTNVYKPVREDRAAEPGPGLRGISVILPDIV